jgi:hypothetical protein
MERDINKPVGDNARKGAVKKRIQLKARLGGVTAWTKRSKASGEFMAVRKPPRRKRLSRIQGRPAREVIQPTEAAASSWRGRAIEKLRNGGNELCRRERCSQKDAVGNAPRGPFIGGAGHVDDREGRVDFSGLPCDFPPIHRAEQIDSGDECPVMAPVAS